MDRLVVRPYPIGHAYQFQGSGTTWNSNTKPCNGCKPLPRPLPIEEAQFDNKLEEASKALTIVPIDKRTTYHTSRRVFGEKMYWATLTSNTFPNSKDVAEGSISFHGSLVGKRTLCVKGLKFDVTLTQNSSGVNSMEGTIFVAYDSGVLELNTKIDIPDQNACKYKGCKIEKSIMALLVKAAQDGAVVVEVTFKGFHHLYKERNEVASNEILQDLDRDEKLDVEISDEFIPIREKTVIIMKASSGTLLRLLQSEYVYHIEESNASIR